jgi:hypothetical protein
MKNIIENLLNEGKLLYVNKIVSYYIIIDNDEVIDYILLSFNDKIIFSLNIDSSGENITLIDYDELFKKLDFSGFKYNKRVELNIKENLKNINLKYSDIEELNFISLIFENITFSIKIGMDCFIIEKSR